MSDTPKRADDAMKVLDNGWGIVLFKNGLGSYTAVAVELVEGEEAGSHQLTQLADSDGRTVITDDFTPSQVLYRLAEKVATGRIA